MENPIKMDDLGGKSPYFWKHPYSSFRLDFVKENPKLTKSSRLMVLMGMVLEHALL